MGINIENCYPITSPTKFKNIILPDGAFFYDDLKNIHFTNEYRDTVERIINFAKKNFSPMTQKKFYFFHGRNHIGEERLANYFQSKGYAIVQPERLPLEVQLNVLANCENFASPIGSISHNTLFVNDKTETVFVSRISGSASNAYQQIINELKNLNAFYIDSCLSVFTQSHAGPYCYIVSENLRKHFGDEIKEKYTDEDFVTFLVYLRYAKMNGLKENPGELEYLKNILPEFIAQLRTRTDLLEKFAVTIQ